MLSVATPVTSAVSASPLDKVPCEILREIFIAAVSPYEWTTFDMKAAPWVLCHVCSQWRTVAQSTPQLWARILANANAVRPALQAEIVKAWISYSKSYPLTVRILGKDSSAPSVSLLVAESHRWQIADVSGLLGFAGAFDSVEGKLPLLQELRLPFREYDFPLGTSTVVTAFKTAPKLRNLFASRCLLSCFPTPYCNLEIVTGVVRSNIEIYNLLRDTLKIVDLSLYGNDYGWEEESQPPERLSPKLTLPRLKKLHLESDLKILDFLILPDLRTLSVSATELNIDGDPDSEEAARPIGRTLAALLSRSRSPLTELTICEGLIRSPELVAMFEAAGSLETLGVEFVTGLDTQFLEQITYHPETGACLLPRLNRINFYCNRQQYERMGSSFSALLDFLESRFHPSAAARGIPQLKISLWFTEFEGKSPVDPLQTARIHALANNRGANVLWRM